MSFIKNFIGSLQGYSGCSHCGGTWNWKKDHNIPYSDSGGMFPLCEECYQKLSPEERYDYCLELWRSWGCPNRVSLNRIAEEVGLQSSTQKVNKE